MPTNRKRLVKKWYFLKNELLTVLQLKFFRDGYPVLSTIALSCEDFMLCGQVMGMSIMQGGPAPNFLAPDIVCYLVGKGLSIDGNKDPKIKAVADSVSTKLKTLLF